MSLSPSIIQWFNAHGQEVLRHLSKHVVGLSWIHALCERRCHTGDYNRDWEVKSETATTFLLASHRFCFLVTAGHRITALNDTTASPRRLIKAYVHTGLHRDAESRAVLFPLMDLPRFHIDDEVLGLDYGAILLDNDAAKVATKLGNAPVRPRNWEGELGTTDMHTMLGFPVEQRERTRRVEGDTMHESLKCGTPLLPLEEMDDPETYSLDAPYDRFCARIVSREGHFEDKEIFLLDVNGMSGGPIFALQAHADRCDYHLVAIQSEWSESAGVVVGCYITPFIEAVTKKIEQLEQREG